MKLALAILLVVATAAEARPHRPPDLSGLWTNATLTDLERPEDFKTLVIPDAEAAAYEAKHRGKPPEIPDDVVGGSTSEWWETDVGMTRIGGQARSSMITWPEDGQIPKTDAVKAARKARRERRKVDFDNPESRGLGERCLETDAVAPLILPGAYNANYQIVQTVDHIAIMAEWMHDLRIIRLDLSPHLPPSQRRWTGDSVGHWEDVTLVIDTTNFTPAEVDAPNGDPTADMHVVERLTRLANGDLHYAFTIESPSQFKQGWRGELIFRPTKGPIYEFACHEGNYSLRGMLSAARQADASGK